MKPRPLAPTIYGPVFDSGIPSRTVVAAALAEGRCRAPSRNEIRARSVVGSHFVPLQREPLAPLATLVHSDANVKAVARSITRQLHNASRMIRIPTASRFRWLQIRSSADHDSLVSAPPMATRTEGTPLRRGEMHEGVVGRDADRHVHDHQHEDGLGRLALGQNVYVR